MCRRLPKAVYKELSKRTHNDDPYSIPLPSVPTRNDRLQCYSVTNTAKTQSTWMQSRAIAQAVSRRPLTAEARVRSPVGLYAICGGQSGTGTGFSLSTSEFPTGAPLHGKTKKLIIFIIGYTISLQGCGASVASAAGYFNNNKKNWMQSQRYKKRHADINLVPKPLGKQVLTAETWVERHQLQFKSTSHINTRLWGEFIVLSPSLTTV
jgi:hypothetical protein